MQQKEALKLDSKDRKILAELELNSRETNAAIARKVGLSKASVAARIARLKKSGLMNRFVVWLNYDALGLSSYRLSLKFENVPPGFESEVIKFLYTRGYVRWFTFTQGEWDVVLRMLVANRYEFKQAEDEMMAKFGKHIKVKIFSMNVTPALHKCTFLTGNEGSIWNNLKKYKGGKVELSKKEYEILFWLYEDSRMPLKEIAERVGLSPDVVSYHMKKMLEKQVFFGYGVRFERTKVGYIETKVLVWLQYETPKRFAEFVAYCDAHPNVSFFGDVLGSWDMEVDIDAKDTQELYVILRDMKNKFPDLIRDMSVLLKVREFEANPLAKQAGIDVSKMKVPEFDL